MHSQQLAADNIENLTRLWKCMGSKACVLENMHDWQMSESWPYRCWLDGQWGQNKGTQLSYSINELPREVIIPVWPLADTKSNWLKTMLVANGFGIVLEQTAMHLNLRDYVVQAPSGLILKMVDSAGGCERWTDIAARSFGYGIDATVIKRIVNNHDIQLLLAQIGSQPVATALLFQTGHIIGIHQVGVLDEYRGQGIARKLMHDVLGLCKQSMARDVSLQASLAGEHLYKTLGFKAQFKINSYQRYFKQSV